VADDSDPLLPFIVEVLMMAMVVEKRSVLSLINLRNLRYNILMLPAPSYKNKKFLITLSQKSGWFKLVTLLPIRFRIKNHMTESEFADGR
jgi:hypothetical protein